MQFWKNKDLMVELKLTYYVRLITSIFAWVIKRGRWMAWLYKS
jgi:hypothetical protein